MTDRQRRMLVLLLFMMLVGAGLETMGTSMLIPFITVAMEPGSIYDNKYLN